MQNYDAVMTVAPGTTPASLAAPAAHHHHHHHHQHQQQHLHHRHHQQQQHEESVQQQTSANWYDLQIKSEPIDYHHHHHHQHRHHLQQQQQQQHTDTPLSSADHSNPTSPQSVDSMDSSSLGKSAGFGSGTAAAAASLLSGGYNPLGFNPLTPPGYSGLLVPPPTTTGGMAAQQHRLGTPHRNGATAAVNLTPTHTPPMDVTPPKSPKESGTDRTPIKGGDGGQGQGGVPSGCEGSNDGSDDEEGIRKPKVNSHGQVKKFKCKQCDFVAVTKLSFWEHTRHHIKPEKMLTCPQCPFVTEYKHHLEYHLRNHQRSKPFQCPECTYTCVNKSMLNSHMKSHSSVLQYHCANCQYATKYCHSLKLHLRKNGHKPGVVLNQDGTPNPLPIIDVYGTRRGPKAKPAKASSTGKKQESAGEPEPKSTPATPQQHPGGSSPRGDRSPYTPLGGGPVGNSTAGANGLMRNLLPHQLFPNPLASMFKSAAAANGSLPLFPYLNLNFQMFADQQAAAMAAQLSPGSFQQSLIGQLAGGVNLNNNHSGSEDNDLSLKSSSTTSNSSNSSTLGEELLKQITAAAADSSASAVKVKSAGCFEDSEPDTDRLFEPDYRGGLLAAAAAISNPVTPSTGNRTERSRRKGRAFKLERMPSSSSNGPAQEMDTQEQYTADEAVLTRGPATPRLADGNKEQEQITPEKAERSFECKYCDIAFRDDVLYTIHMGYHGYDEVFKCNMCGEKSEDRIGFFLHIARKAH